MLFEIAIFAALYFFDNGALAPARNVLPETVDWQTYFDLSPVFCGAIGLLLIILIFASVVGVLLFRNWGRWLYLIVSLLILPVSVFTGPAIYYGWETALWDMLQMANGAVMLAMFLPPISNEFNTFSQQNAESCAAI
ncbi:hypothetical protein LMJ53_12805 [Rheinheimera sp. UJ51]|uniref:hypothetical protein n=1 Tax=Rheinheimera sp. UJ51 TaxID=2892446 RepID=UPI001E2CE686|nr:hypothetical protein [Rheinheimera sp. UJ51]MCC5452601.1 hypothetical protein [Rheinheimera sp. UJ51]